MQMISASGRLSPELSGLSQYRDRERIRRFFKEAVKALRAYAEERRKEKDDILIITELSQTFAELKIAFSCRSRLLTEDAI